MFRLGTWYTGRMIRPIPFLLLLTVTAALALMLALTLATSGTTVGCPPWAGERQSRIQVTDTTDEDVEWLVACGFRREDP